MDHEFRIIKENLDTLGLSKTEQKTLLLLMEIQTPLPVSALAPELEVPRQTANTILRNMSKRGIVLQTHQNGISCFHTNRKQISAYVDALCDKLQKAKIAIINS